MEINKDRSMVYYNFKINNCWKLNYLKFYNKIYIVYNNII